MSMQIYQRLYPTAPIIDKQIALVATQFNAHIVECLLKDMLATLKKEGIAEGKINIITVPGAFELPLMCEIVAQSNKYEGIIALGAVIRGDTPHFDFVASSCVQGLQQVILKHTLPIILGVLTTDSEAQALARLNKGSEFALALLDMLFTIKKL